jgi:murein L,D-transpeptidase YafK
MNPNSSYYLSFDTGYPNAYDRAHGGTGSYLMVHGSCSSRGCYAMTDEGIAEVYALAREAFASGQKGFQFQAFPFKMTAQNLTRFRHDPNMPYWRNLKEGNDVFEITKREAKVAVCKGRYAFNTVDGSARPIRPSRRRWPRRRTATARRSRNSLLRVRRPYASSMPMAASTRASAGRPSPPWGTIGASPFSIRGPRAILAT